MTPTGRRIHMAMERRGWNMTRLSDEVGVSQTAISQVVNGVRKGLRLLPKIAEALEVRVEWLTVGDPELEPEWVRQLRSEQDQVAEDALKYMAHESAAKLTAIIARLEKRLEEEQQARESAEAELAEVKERLERMEREGNQ